MAGRKKEEFSEGKEEGLLKSEKASETKKVLVVEDDLQLAEMIEALLLGEGYEVTSLDSAEEAMDLVGSERFDVVVSDMHTVGQKTGEDLAAKVKTLINPPSFILTSAGFSANSLVRITEEGRVQSGVYWRIAKPFSATPFLNTVEECYNISPSRMANEAKNLPPTAPR